jgi:hypothetical protein
VRHSQQAISPAHNSTNKEMASQIPERPESFINNPTIAIIAVLTEK